MDFLWPTSLAGLAVVAAVAAWALIRPGRQEAVIGSFAIWEKALAALDRSAKRSTKRITLVWILLLAGAAGGVVALARPVVQIAKPHRSVALSLIPSAELGTDGRAEITAAASRLLDRLSPADRVQLVLPQSLGGLTGPITPAEAREQIEGIELLPAPAARLSMPPLPGELQHTYVFAPPQANRPLGPRSTAIVITSHLPAATIDAIGAAAMTGDEDANSTAGQAQLFVAVRSHTGKSLVATVRIETLGPALESWKSAGQVDVTIPAGGRSQAVIRLPQAEAIRAVLTSPDGAELDTAQLARLGAQRRKVAIVGRDEPMLRRFIQADVNLELTGSPNGADIVIANRINPPAGKPALVIDPPDNPQGWVRAAPRKAVILSDANLAADDPLLDGVNLAAAAVRRVRPWTRRGTSMYKPIAATGGGAMILADPASYAGPIGAGGGAGRIYIAFELSGDNTNLGTSDAFVILLANAMGLLAPPGRAQVEYEYVPPIRASTGRDWKRVSDDVSDGAMTSRSGPLPAPGVYLDDTRRIRAVSLVGLRSDPVTAPADPMKAVADAPLPKPQTARSQWELWPILAVAAMILWLAGWAMRTR